MQRRAAAVYFALFLVIGAGAYAYTGVAQEPNVNIDQYGQTYTTGDGLSVNGRAYTVTKVNKSGSGMIGSLRWTDTNATFSTSIENNSTVSWQAVSWEGQAGIESATFQNGSSMQYNGSRHTVLLNTSASPPTMTLRRATNGSTTNGTNVSSDTYEKGGAISFRTADGRLILGATITNISGSQATLKWGEDYLAVVPNETDPSTVTFTQQFNVSRRLKTDPGVKNETITSEGEKYVVNRTTNSLKRLSEYLPEPQATDFSEGEQLTYNGNVTTIENITSSSVPLNWTGTENRTVDLSEGASLSLNGQQYFVHFSDTSTVKLVQNSSEAWEAYQSELESIDDYHERIAGLWAVAILSVLAALILLFAAYLPVKD